MGEFTLKSTDKVNDNVGEFALDHDFNIYKLDSLDPNYDYKPCLISEDDYTGCSTTEVLSEHKSYGYNFYEKNSKVYLIRTDTSYRNW